jgi:hypothetical protein
MLRVLYKKSKIVSLIACIVTFCACSDYLDLVPDGDLATLETAFELRTNAKKYLFTCYSYMGASEREGSSSDPAILGGDQFAPLFNIYQGADPIARGLQNAVSPYANNWTELYQALRVCNIFLENVGNVPDLPQDEREQWIGEVLFLKAYYHFCLVRKWGPVPLIRENIPVYAGVEGVRIAREPVDECFDYIIELLNEAIPRLPLTLANPHEELGRICKPIAASFKAKVCVFAASPLFSNNSEMATLVNKDNTRLFKDESAEVVQAKWDSAVVACREAIKICHDANYRLYKYATIAELSDTIITQLTLRNTFNEKWNSEMVWATTQTTSGDIQYLQSYGWPYLEGDKYTGGWDHSGIIQVAKKIVDQFYTNHGVPVEEDKDWAGVDPLSLRTGDASHSYYIKKNYTTVQMHFDREPRFYATFGFDGGLWYGQGSDGARNGNDPDKYFYVRSRFGDPQGRKVGGDGDPFTGYWPKKYVHFENAQTGVNSNSFVDYPWSLLRLSDLFLLYAEAINEAEGPNGAHSADLFAYIDSVRAKSGLPGVKVAWDTYTNNKKYNNKVDMREIIQRERLIELALEGSRFWDIRRWKTAPFEYAKGIYGWTMKENDPEKFYKPVKLIEQPFSERDYFWPIQISLIEQNPNLVQNIGW